MTITGFRSLNRTIQKSPLGHDVKRVLKRYFFKPRREQRSQISCCQNSLQQSSSSPFHLAKSNRNTFLSLDLFVIFTRASPAVWLLSLVRASPPLGPFPAPLRFALDFRSLAHRVSYRKERGNAHSLPTVPIYKQSGSDLRGGTGSLWGCIRSDS